MARWKCSNCGNRVATPGERGDTDECPLCRKELLCHGSGMELAIPPERYK